MSIFYCCLANENTRRVYHFFKRGFNLTKENTIPLQTIFIDSHIYMICFHGNLINEELGAMLLKEHNITYHNDKEYLIALYRLYRNDIKNFFSESSFVLIDDGSTVFIYSKDPLYFARKRRGDIFISSDKGYIEGNHIFKINGHNSLFFFNNNLKLL